MAKAKPQDKRFVMISVVSERYDIHPQTLRMYEREGLLEPNRSQGNTRLYDDTALKRLETILTLTRDMGVNLAGVEVILRLRDQVKKLSQENRELRHMIENERSEKVAGVRRRHALVRVSTGALVRVDET